MLHWVVLFPICSLLVFSLCAIHTESVLDGPYFLSSIHTYYFVFQNFWNHFWCMSITEVLTWTGRSWMSWYRNHSVRPTITGLLGGGVHHLPSSEVGRQVRTHNADLVPAVVVPTETGRKYCNYTFCTCGIWIVQEISCNISILLLFRLIKISK